MGMRGAQTACCGGANLREEPETKKLWSTSPGRLNGGRSCICVPGAGEGPVVLCWVPGISSVTVRDAEDATLQRPILQPAERCSTGETSLIVPVLICRQISCVKMRVARFDEIGRNPTDLPAIGWGCTWRSLSASPVQDRLNWRFVASGSDRGGAAGIARHRRQRLAWLLNHAVCLMAGKSLCE